MDVSYAYSVCVDELKKFAASAGFTEVVLGISGGIDSSVVAVMCVDAFGADKVHGLLLPGPYTSTASIEDAWALADTLGIEMKELSINGLYDNFNEVLSPICGGDLEGLASQNTQARCRMVCLMALSNTYGWMVVNTGNMSEGCMGYNTLYGDAIGAFAPLGSLYKTEVYAVARWINERDVKRGKKPAIPQRVIDRPPSAELAPDQEDEASLGIDYTTLDALLKVYLEDRLPIPDILDLGFTEEQLKIMEDRFYANTFKRKMAPPSPDRGYFI